MRVFVCPALMDWILSLVSFAVSYGAGERGMTVPQLAWLGGVFPAAYMVGSLGCGLLLSRRNALPILIASVVGAVATGLACLASSQFGPLLVAMLALGGCSSFVFNSFQSFMRSEAPPGGLLRATAVYTLAWSSGASFGLVTSGSLFRKGPWALGGVTVLLGVVMAGTLLLHKARPHHEPSAEEHTEHGPEGAAPVLPEYVWVGWIIMLTCIGVQSPIRQFYPAISARQRISPEMAMLPLFLQTFIQAIVGYLMLRLRSLLYRFGPLLAVQLASAAVLFVVWQFPSYAVSAVGISVLGLWCGFGYFCPVYYAGNAGDRARNISINECLVGVGTIASLFVCEWFMSRPGASPAVMYAVCGAALLAACAAQWVVLMIGRRRARNAEIGRR